jgi:hypothetical protein
MAGPETRNSSRFHDVVFEHPDSLLIQYSGYHLSLIPKQANIQDS